MDKTQGFTYFGSSELNKATPLKCFLSDLFWKLLLFFLFPDRKMMVMLLHKGGRYLLFHAKNACLNQTREHIGAV